MCNINIPHPNFPLPIYLLSKVRYPCFLKAPFLTSCKGHSMIKTEAEMVVALAKLEELCRPYFTGYSEFFRRFLDLEKFPLAVKNIALVEELVDSGEQYCVEGWVDEVGKFTLWTVGYEIVSPKTMGVLCWVIPQFTLKKDAFDEMVKFTEKLGQRFGLRSTFYDAELWKRGDELTLIEVNGRSTTIVSQAYKTMWGTSIYEAAVNLACGETAKLQLIPVAAVHKDGDPISGQFISYTCWEGKGEEFVDFDYARAGCHSDGVYGNDGPGMTLGVAEESLVQQVSSNGFVLGHFLLSDHSSANIFRRAKEVVSKFVRRSEDRDLFDFNI